MPYCILSARLYKVCYGVNQLSIAFQTWKEVWEDFVRGVLGCKESHVRSHVSEVVKQGRKARLSGSTKV